MVDTIKIFIKVERTGDLDLHLACIMHFRVNVDGMMDTYTD